MFRHLATTSWTEFFPRYKAELMMKPSHFKSNNAQSFGDYLGLNIFYWSIQKDQA